METIPIFFTFDRYYVLAACVAFHSLLTNAAPEYQYQLYVVHTDLQPHHIQRIKKKLSLTSIMPIYSLKMLPIMTRHGINCVISRIFQKRYSIN